MTKKIKNKLFYNTPTRSEALIIFSKRIYGCVSENYHYHFIMHHVHMVPPV